MNQDLSTYERSGREYQTLGHIRIHRKRTSELHSLIVMGLVWSPVKQRKTVMLLIVSPMQKATRCVHLTLPDLSASKTSIEYIELVTKFRGDSPSDIIDDISDPRNGLLLLHSVHRYVGRGDSAFILVRHSTYLHSRFPSPYIFPSRPPISPWKLTTSHSLRGQ